MDGPTKQRSALIIFVANIHFLLKWPRTLNKSPLYISLNLLQKNSLIRKIKLISKFMTSQPGTQIIAIHILPKISRSKGNQTMKYGQLTEYNMRNIFFENHSQNVMEKLFPDPFLKNQIISLGKQFALIVCQIWGYQNIL